MKALLITNLFGRYARGGAERVVDAVVEGLRALGHEPVVLTAGPFRWRWFLWPRIDSEEVEAHSTAPRLGGAVLRVYRFFPSNVFSIVTINRRPLWLRFFWHAIDLFNDHPAWMLLWVLHKEKPDVVWTHNLKGLGGWIAPLLRWRNFRHVHQLHDVQLVEPSGLLFPLEAGFRGKYYSNVLKNIRIAGRRVFMVLNRWQMGSPKLVVSPTRWLLELHLQNGFFKNSKTLVLSNPVPSCGVRRAKASTKNVILSDPPTMLGGESKDLAGARPRSLGLTRDDRKGVSLLFAGQLTPHKGIQFLVDALKNAELPFPWQLHIAGTGVLESRLREELVNDPRFELYGKLSPEALEEIWKQVDLTIVPSFCLENAPMVIMESLVRRIPVLASRVGGIPEMVRDGEHGWLFLAGDREDFLKKLANSVGKIHEEFTPAPLDTEMPREYIDKVLSAL